MKFEPLPHRLSSTTTFSTFNSTSVEPDSQLCTASVRQSELRPLHNQTREYSLPRATLTRAHLAPVDQRIAIGSDCIPGKFQRRVVSVYFISRCLVADVPVERRHVRPLDVGHLDRQRHSRLEHGRVAGGRSPLDLLQAARRHPEPVASDDRAIWRTHHQCRCHAARISAVQLGPIMPSARQQFRLTNIRWVVSKDAPVVRPRDAKTQKLERDDEKDHRNHPSHTGRRHAVAR